MKILFARKVCQVADNSLNQIESSLAKVGMAMTPLPTRRQKMKTLFDPLTGLKGSEL